MVPPTSGPTVDRITTSPPMVAAIGEAAVLRGFALAGVRMYAAETVDDIRRTWASLPAETGVVILTPRAATALGSALSDPRSPLTVVLPA